MAVAIDIGNLAIDRAFAFNGGVTFLDGNNPANANGTLTSVQIYLNNSITGLRIGTFYYTGVSGEDKYKCRDSVSLGNAAAGLNTFLVSLSVKTDDLIGCYFSGSSALDRESGGIYFYATAEYIDPGDEVEYVAGIVTISLYGTGIADFIAGIVQII